jgi:hypothetical protein
MPRRKNSPTYIEGPEAFENFRKLAQHVVTAGRSHLSPKHETVTEKVTITEVETLDIVVPRRRKRPIK